MKFTEIFWGGVDSYKPWNCVYPILQAILSRSISLERLCKFPQHGLPAEESLEEMGQHKSLSRKYNYLLILTLRGEAPE